jgi:LytS/YehU family sensor histidine kinase
MLTKSLESDVNMNKLLQKSNQTAAAATLQSAVRRKTDMMKKRQLVGEEQLKQMEETQRQIQAAKADKAKKEDIAAKQLQAISKRIKAQSDVSKIKQAKDKIGAAATRLLTERVDPHYINQIKKTVIMNKNTAGQRLVVNKKLKLVSKKRHDAGVFGYETRQDYLDLAQQYKPIMTKGQKK